MKRCPLRRDNQPAPLSWFNTAIEWIASIELSVIIMAVLAVIMAWATFVESAYSFKIITWFVYGSWWFFALNVLFSINVLMAMLIRLPWRRRHIGFLVVHGGILVIMFGALLTTLYGVDSNLTVEEGEKENRAVESQLCIRLKVEDSPKEATADDDSEAEETKADAPEETAEKTPEYREIIIPFSPGPFNWAEYEHRSWFPWKLVGYQHGTIYDQDGIKVEVLDYCQDSLAAAIPKVELAVKPIDGDNIVDEATLVIRKPQLNPAMGVDAATLAAHGRQYPSGFGQLKTLADKYRVSFRLAGSEAEVQAFLDSAPEGDLGDWGQMVIWHGGKTYRVSVDQMANEGPQPLGDSGLKIGLFEQAPPQHQPGFSVMVIDEADESSPRLEAKMMITAGDPTINIHDFEKGYFGEYWAPADSPIFLTNQMPEHVQAMFKAKLERPRLDLLEGPDDTLYYRLWAPPKVLASGKFPNSETSSDNVAVPQLGGRLEAFAESKDAVEFILEDFVPSDKPGWGIVPVPYAEKKADSKKSATQKRYGNSMQRVKIRLTVGDQSETFWMRNEYYMQMGKEWKRPFWNNHEYFKKYFKDEPGVFPALVDDGKQKVQAAMSGRPLTLGFDVKLIKFHRRLEPGSAMASKYSSTVDLLDHETGKPLTLPDGRSAKNIIIEMNRPIDVPDPKTGIVYRLYQTSYKEWSERHGFYSTLSVNYDPGRTWKYVGSYMVCFGMVIVFFMQRLLGRRKKSETEPDDQSGSVDEAKEENLEVNEK